MGAAGLLERVKIGRTGWGEFAALVGIGLFMASVNAFDGHRSGVSYAYWISVMVAGGAVGALVEVGLRRLPRLADRPGLLAVAQVFAMTPPVALTVWLIAGFAFQVRQTVGDYLSLVPQVFIVDIVVVALAVLLRVAARAMAGPGPTPTRDGVAPPAIRAKLPPKHARAALLAVEAEDHYLRVHTEAGDALILMRLADALAALEATPGLQVHRSWWVARDAVEHVEWRRGRGEAVLRGGLRAPVSRGFAPAVKATDWAEA